MKVANGLKTVAEILLALFTIFLLFMGIGEISGGDFNGLAHLLSAAVLGGLMWLVWRQPLYAGIILTLVGFLNVVIYASRPTLDILNWYFPILIMGLPWLLTGLLLIFAAWKASKATS